MTLFIILCLIFIAWGAFIFFKFKSVEKDAHDIFQARKDEDADFQALGEEKYVEIYKRVFNPRGHVINFCASLIAVICLPSFYFIASWIWNTLWNAGGRIADLDEGFAPWLFGISIICIAGLISIAAIAGRLHHHNRPKSLEQEINIHLEGQSQ